MEFGREAVAEHLVKNNMPTSEKLKKAFEEFVDDDWIAKDLEKYHERIMELRDKTLLVEFARKICLLLAENGVKVVGNIVDDMSFDEENNIYSGKSELDIEHLDFSEHDKPFEDKIAKLETLLQKQDEFLDMKNLQIDELKQRISELESEKSEKPTEINFNDQIKVKLTPLGVEIYYHQYDDLNESIKKNGGTPLEPRMPQIDKDGYTKFTLWKFMELYGQHIGICKPNVVSPLYIELCPDEWKIRYDKEPIEKMEKSE